MESSVLNVFNYLAIINNDKYGGYIQKIRRKYNSSKL